jgi:hypothetical protein
MDKEMVIHLYYTGLTVKQISRIYMDSLNYKKAKFERIDLRHAIFNVQMILFEHLKIEFGGVS